MIATKSQHLAPRIDIAAQVEQTHKLSLRSIQEGNSNIVSVEFQSCGFVQARNTTQATRMGKLAQARVSRHGSTYPSGQTSM